jgi:hypothetical protein
LAGQSVGDGTTRAAVLFEAAQLASFTPISFAGPHATVVVATITPPISRRVTTVTEMAARARRD